ncbi:type II toxin-antitoxin system RelE/ParE family toxin [Arsukibacterium indicum]|uniref:Toxin n=1 Tax=Arsukibacterium indicum TaxID=2848612 RepID=A0ABS6MP60_9GAMM|nr:type II toxin-antitoxin system RelE/ParE family toxin [Arsukibacterium indicum]MBV2130583.1 type II toxin-antitoxin system RelE/ParE family toxin [Arsukibacterium indicum]
MKKKLSDEAKADLVEIRHYTLHQWGAAQSSKYIAAISATINNLADNPLMGVPRDDIKEGVRLFVHGRHVIYYIVRHQLLIVIRVLNTMVQPEPRLVEVEIPD